MRTLFAISIVALLALLWAAFSIARHVRRARRQRRSAIRNAPPAVITAQTSEPDDDVPAQRVSPAPLPFANPSRTERPDWAYFNKDLGDLSDPYQDRGNKPRSPSAP